MYVDKTINIMLLLIAAGSLMVSYHYEYQAFSLPSPGTLVGTNIPIAHVMAAISSAGKLALIWIVARGNLTGSIMSGSLKILMILLSLLCSSMVISSNVFQSNMGNVLETVKKEVSKDYMVRENSLRTRYKDELNAISKNYIDLRAETTSRYSAEIKKYEEILKKQESVKYKNSEEYRGPIYKENLRLLTIVKSKLSLEIADLQSKESKERIYLNSDRKKESQQLARQRTEALGKVTPENYKNRDQVESKLIMPLLNVFNESFGSAYKPTHVSLLLATAITLMVEFLPIVLILYLAQLQKGGSTNTPPPGTPSRSPQSKTSKDELILATA